MAASESGRAVSPDRGELDLPDPPVAMELSFIQISAGTLLHRVHLSRYQACQYNPGTQGNARFSPIQDGDAQPVPTLYAGSTLACALMETVFHDVPYTSGFKSLDRARLVDQVHSTILVQQNLLMVDLSSVALRKLGLQRRQLIDTEKDTYPATRRWAAAIHRQCSQAQGLAWVSRQDDTARAMMLFGQRIPADALALHAESRGLLTDESAYEVVLSLADRLGVCLVPGRR